MALDFRRWRRKGTRIPVARVHVTYAITLEDLVTVAVWIANDALDEAGFDRYSNEPSPADFTAAATRLTRANVEQRLRVELANYGEFRLDSDPSDLLVSTMWEVPLIEAVTPIVQFLFPDAVPEEE